MEKVQKGNPRGLTTRQHVFPEMSIFRFTDDDGNVSVNLIPQGKIIKCKPRNEIFCVDRYWDQKSERGYMKQIEDRFQSLVCDLINNTNRKIYKTENTIISEMYALWRLRFYASHNPIKDQAVIGVSGENLTKDQEEILESKGYIFMRSKEAVLPGRFMTGIRILMEMNQILEEIKYANWSLAFSENINFIAPECFHTHAILPVSPRMVLISDNEKRVLSDTEVRSINILAIKSSIKYWFAKDVSCCF